MPITDEDLKALTAVSTEGDPWNQPPAPELRLAVAAERIATALEAIEKHLAPVITGTPSPDSILHELNTAPIPNADGWIEWHGGERPVAIESMVDVKLRRGTHSFSGPARALYWDHTGSSGDIIAYRLAK